MSLKEYADKFLDQIDQYKPINLLGVSFGGMLCAEIAEKLPVNNVFLVSSCKNRGEFPIFLKFLKIFPLYKFVPEKAIRSVARTKRKFIGFEKSFEPVFIDMINSMPENYFSCCIKYIITWERKTNTAKTIQIHGTADRLLTCGTIKNYYPIEGGSHAIVLSNALEINAILNKELNGQ